MRQAVREEIGSLIREGILPGGQTQYQAAITQNRLAPHTEQTGLQTSINSEEQSLTKIQTGYQSAARQKDGQVSATRQLGYGMSVEEGYLNGQLEPLTGSQRSNKSEEGGKTL